MAEGLILRPEPDLSEFALIGHTHSQYLTSHQSLSNYATKTYVQNQIAAIDFPDAGVTTFNGRAGAVVPKSGDYTAAMVGAAATTHTHSTYAAKTHTHSEYLTSHQSLTNYATKTWVNTQIESMSSGGGIHAVPLNFPTKSYTLDYTPDQVIVICITYAQLYNSSSGTQITGIGHIKAHACAKNSSVEYGSLIYYSSSNTGTQKLSVSLSNKTITFNTLDTKNSLNSSKSDLDITTYNENRIIHKHSGSVSQFELIILY